MERTVAGGIVLKYRLKHTKIEELGESRGPMGLCRKSDIIQADKK